MNCHICGANEAQEYRECKACHKFFCLDHASPMDGEFCAVCVCFANAKIERKPLVDTNGVQHRGSQLILTGEAWMRSRDVIANMTDVELELKLTSLKKAVHEAELVLDFRKIAMNQAENEKSTRQSRTSSRLRLIKGISELHKNTVSTPSEGQARVDAAKDAIASLKKMGLNQTAIANILITLSAKKKDV